MFLDCPAKSLNAIRITSLRNCCCLTTLFRTSPATLSRLNLGAWCFPEAWMLEFEVFSSPLRSLSHHVLCILILPQAHKCRLPQMVIPRPFGKTDLANQPRFQPRAPPHLSQRHSRRVPTGQLLGKVRKGALNPLQLFKLRMKRCQQLLIE